MRFVYKNWGKLAFLIFPEDLNVCRKKVQRSLSTFTVARVVLAGERGACPAKWQRRRPGWPSITSSEYQSAATGANRDAL